MSISVEIYEQNKTHNHVVFEHNKTYNQVGGFSQYLGRLLTMKMITDAKITTS